MSKPIIGITKPENKRLNFPFLAILFAIWLGGGKPKIISAKKGRADEPIDGLMLGGGTDVFPGHFFKEPKENYRYDLARDQMEIALLKRADEERIPVFAICRGAQLMNVVNKGTLHMDMARVYEGTDYPQNVFGYIFYRKKILIEEESLLNHIFQEKEMMVNSIHRQSIGEVGNGLKITAREPNGVVQAIEKPDRPFYLGVQFHPERLLYRKSFRSFFRLFIGAARDYQQKKHEKIDALQPK